MEPIAIIGTSFKLPQSIDDDLALWDLLENARNVMTPWPESRLNLDAFYNPDQSKPNSVGNYINFRVKLGVRSWILTSEPIALCTWWSLHVRGPCYI